MKFFFILNTFFWLLINSHICFSQINNRFIGLEVKDTYENFNCEYVNVPLEYTNSLNYAFYILDNFFVSEIGIKVKMIFREPVFFDNNVAGGAQPTAFYTNLSDKFIPDTYYPVALAEKIEGENLNGDNPDIIVNVNSSFEFYLGIDGDTSHNKVDFATFIIHEVIHGLGFYSSITKIEPNQFIYENNIPTVFDRFLVRHDSIIVVNLGIDDFNKAVESDSIYFDSRYSLNSNNNFFPKMYAPLDFDFGGTFSHLDNNDFPAYNLNSLMRPKKEINESIHDPGEVTLGIMAQLGWIDYFISVEKVLDKEFFSDTTQIVVHISDSLNHENVYLVYSLDNFYNCDSILMINDTNNLFIASIPPAFPFFEHTVKFYITTQDRYNNSICSRVNLDFPTYHSYYVGVDRIAPIIEHDFVKLVNENDSYLVLRSKVIDNIEVDLVYVLINHSDSLTDTIICNFIGNNYYECELSFTNSFLFENDFFSYKIVSVDKSISSNISFLPEDDYNNVNIFRESSIIHSYYQNFDIPTDDFELDGFSILKPEGFSNNALHTTHPYSSTGLDNTYNQYIAMLKKPIQLDISFPYLEFDEIALVEPSEFGVSFNQFGFWDYVIVEGSKDKQNWHAFELEGYDSRLHDKWLKRYYSLIDENKNSLALADESIYERHKINLLYNKFLRHGDYIFLRFRMQTDAKVNAWGWCIDNISIQNNPLQVETFEYDDDILIFPNPSNSFVKVAISENVKLDDIQLLNFKGELLQNNIVFPYNIEHLDNGIYFLKFILKEKVISKKITIIK